jgi:hypothetical protein
MIGTAGIFGQEKERFSMVIRVRKQDSAYVYRILESYEGLTNFSTLGDEFSGQERDIVLHIPPDQKAEVIRLVERLKEEIPVEVIKA